MSNVGISHMRRAAHQLESIKARIAHHKEKAERVATHLIGTAEVCAGAFAGGFLLGRFPDKTVLNQKPDLVGGVVLVAASAADLFGRQTDHVLEFGKGMLASATTRLGVNQGAKMRGGASSAGEVFAGELPAEHNVIGMHERAAARAASAYAPAPRF